jgi:hypothetical protein
MTEFPSCPRNLRSDWHARICGRPAKFTDTQGRPVCGVHLRYDAKVAERDARWREQDERERKLAERRDYLELRLGITLGLDFSGAGAHAVTGRLTISPTELDKLINPTLEKP